MPRPTANDARPEDKKGIAWTPLSLAVANGYIDAVRELLQVGADSTVRDPEGRTLRETALTGGHQEIAALLDRYETRELADGADPNASPPRTKR